MLWFWNNVVELCDIIRFLVPSKYFLNTNALNELHFYYNYIEQGPEFKTILGEKRTLSF